MGRYVCWLLAAALGSQAVLVLSGSMGVEARTLRVPSAYPALHDAVLALAPGDTILIAPGTYSGNGNRDLVLPSFDITVLSDDGPEATILDCAGEVFESHWGFRLAGDGSGSFHLEGLTVQHAYLEYGRGAAIYAGNAIIMVKNCAFLDNVSGGHEKGGGGAVSVSNSTARFEDCCFIRNSAGLDGAGGAIQGIYSNIALESCFFGENGAMAGGGAVHVWGELLATECTFFDNWAGFYGGGGAVTYGGTVGRLEQSILVGNSTMKPNDGGAIEAGQGALHILSCTIADNASGDAGAAIYLSEGTVSVARSILAFNSGMEPVTCSDGASIELVCTDVFGHQPADWIGCLSGLEVVDGNFSADPLFCNPVDGDYGLSSSSPCLPGQHPEGADCGIIGALGAACGATATTWTTWGALRHRLIPR